MGAQSILVNHRTSNCVKANGPDDPKKASVEEEAGIVTDEKLRDDLPTLHVDTRETERVVLPSWKTCTSPSQVNGSLPHKSRDGDTTDSAYPASSVTAQPQLKANGIHRVLMDPPQLPVAAIPNSRADVMSMTSCKVVEPQANPSRSEGITLCSGSHISSESAP